MTPDELMSRWNTLQSLAELLFEELGAEVGLYDAFGGSHA